MNTTKHRPIALALMLLAAPGAASAATCSITFSCEQTTMAESAKVQSRISVMQEAVSEAVYTIGENIVAAIADSTAGVTGAMAKNTASANNNAAEIDRANNRRAEVRTRSKTGPGCADAAASQGPRAGGSLGARPVATYQPGQVSDRWKRALAAAGATDRPTIPPEAREAHAADLGQGGCERFGDPGSVRGVLCQAAGVPGQGLNPYLDADIKAATLFDGPLRPDAKVKNLSVPVSGPERDARAAYLTTLTNASPPVTPREATLRTPEGRVYLAARAEYESSQSLANYPAQEFDRLTTVDPATLPALEAIQRADPKFIARYFKGLEPSQYQGGVSPLLLRNLEAERRIGNEDWLKRMAAATAEDKAAEVLMVLAYQTRLENDRYVAQLQTNVLLGKILQNSSESRYRDELELNRGTLEVSKARADAKSSLGQGQRP